MVSRNVKFTLFVVSGLKHEKYYNIPSKSTQHVITHGNNAKFMCGSMFIFFRLCPAFSVSSIFPSWNMSNEIQDSGLFELLSTGIAIL